MSKKKFLVMILVLGTILAFGTAAAIAATFYVDVDTGNDVWPGTGLNPFQTITAALNAVGAHGDSGGIIYVDDGLYDATNDPAIAGADTEAFPLYKTQTIVKDVTIEYKNFVIADSGGAIIDAGGTADAFDLDQVQTFIIKGFTIKNGADADIKISTTVIAATIQGNTFGGDKYGVEISAVATTVNIYDNTFNNTITDAGIQLDAAVGTLDISSATTAPGGTAIPAGNTFTGIAATGSGVKGAIVFNANFSGKAVRIDFNHFNGNLNGIYFTSAATTDPTTEYIEFNEFVGNTNAGVYNAGNCTPLVEKNWWNHKSGPSGLGTGSGDAVKKASGLPDFDPWLQHPLWTVTRYTPASSPAVTRYFNAIKINDGAAVAAGALNFAGLATKDQIIVGEGTYGKCELFPLDFTVAEVTLKASGARANTIIENSSGKTISITKDDVKIGGSGLTIKGLYTSTIGVFLDNTGQILDGVTIEGNYFDAVKWGVLANEPLVGDGATNDITNLTVKDNTFTGPGLTTTEQQNWSGSIAAVQILNTRKFVVSSALITGNTIDHFMEGITFTCLQSSSIVDNEVSDGYVSGIAVNVTSIDADNTQNVSILRNTITNITSTWFPVGSAAAFGNAGIQLGLGQGTVGVVKDITIKKNTISGCKANLTIHRYTNDRAWTQPNMDTITVENNTIQGGGYGVYNGQSNVTLDATNNFWGSYLGPEDSDENPTGPDNKTTGTNVKVKPWLHYPPQTPCEQFTYHDPGYNMVGVPLDAAPNDQPGNVYSNITPLYVYEFDGTSYKTPTHIRPDVGYWLWISGEETVTVCGTEVPSPHTTATLGVGWHIVSTPWPLTWPDDVTGTANVEKICTYDTPTNAYTCYLPGSWTVILNSWEGFWVKMSAAGTLTFTKPAVPPTPASIGIGSTGYTVTALGTAAGSDVPPAPPPVPGIAAAFDLNTIQVMAYPNPVGSTHTVTFEVLGAGAAQVKGLKLEIFDLAGSMVWVNEVAGRTLQWHTQSLGGGYVANGVYLYIVYVKAGGEYLATEVCKLLVLR